MENSFYKKIGKIFLRTKFLTISILLICGSLEAQKMYWSITANNIYRANLDGSSIELIYTGPLNTTNPQGIALDLTNGKLYFCDADSDNIMRMNLDGSMVEVVLSGAGTNLRNLDLDVPNQHVYYADSGAHKIRRVNFDGTGAIDILTWTNSAFPHGIGLDLINAELYYACGGGSGEM